jgi:Membrane bound beta barrel domain (DUF5777)
MSTRHPFHLVICAFGLTWGLGTGAYAQDPTPPPPATAAPPTATMQAAQSSPDEDDARAQPMEPDYRIVNLPTTLRLPRHGSNFTLTHRFNGDLTEGTFLDQLSTLFGMDNGAAIGLEYRYGIARHVEAVAFRTNIEQTIQFTGKFDEWRQGEKSMPLSISPFIAVEGQLNFRENYATSLGTSIGRNIKNRVQVYAVPWWVMNSAAGTGVYRNTVALGMGGRFMIHPRLFLVGEVTPRLGGYTPTDEEYSFAVETRVGGHVFQLNFSNSQQTTFGLLSHGGSNDKLYLGFNLSRKFF